MDASTLTGCRVAREPKPPMLPPTITPLECFQSYRHAGRQANATQEAFARVRSVWPRQTSTTGTNRVSTILTDYHRIFPNGTCARPPGRARACRVLCGLLLRASALQRARSQTFLALLSFLLRSFSFFI